MGLLSHYYNKSVSNRVLILLIHLFPVFNGTQWQKQRQNKPWNSSWATERDKSEYLRNCWSTGISSYIDLYGLQRKKEKSFLKKENFQWVAVLSEKIISWCQRSEENGKIALSSTKTTITPITSCLKKYAKVNLWDLNTLVHLWVVVEWILCRFKAVLKSDPAPAWSASVMSVLLNSEF